jgi:integrase
VPLLSLWTGMRRNEVVQFRTDDVAVSDGVDVILIRTDEEGDKRLKLLRVRGSCPEGWTKL